jgi:hypothetical protein
MPAVHRRPFALAIRAKLYLARAPTQLAGQCVLQAPEPPKANCVRQLRRAHE